MHGSGRYRYSTTLSCLHPSALSEQPTAAVLTSRSFIAASIARRLNSTHEAARSSAESLNLSSPSGGVVCLRCDQSPATAHSSHPSRSLQPPPPPIAPPTQPSSPTTTPPPP